MKQLIKSVTPGPLWRAMASAKHSLFEMQEKVRQPYRVRQWKRQLAAAGGKPAPPSIKVEELKNRLPNSGGIAVDAQALDPKKIIESGYTQVGKRKSGVEGFEGLALDDALGWIEEYRHYSFVPLAQTVSGIAREHLGTPGFTILELGCGWGGLRVLLQAFGSTGYLGVDANPLPFSHSPLMREAPENYRLLNLQETIDFGTTFDVVCSFEVLEHIREDRLDAMLKTISNHLSPRSLFIGTAALTDYTDVHVTVHPRGWWLERFRAHGIVPVEPAKEAVWLEQLARNHPFNWTPASTSIFVLKKT
jgi:hypothetical protein